MSVNHYDYNDSTQLSPHFNAREFRCSCGKSHETLLASELVDKLESLYTALNCSKFNVFNCTNRYISRNGQLWHRISFFFSDFS